MSKDIWIEQFEELISEFENEHPEATYEEAVAYAEAMIDGRYGDALGDMIDAARQRQKDASKWPHMERKWMIGCLIPRLRN